MERADPDQRSNSQRVVRRWPLAGLQGSRQRAPLDANNLSNGPGDDFDTVNPGTPIWGWENPGTGTNGFPEGLQSNCASGGCTENTPVDDPNTIFAALGSQIYGAPTTGDFIEIIAEGPSTTGSLTTSISVSGVYRVGSNKGRIAEWSPAPSPDSINHDTYTGTWSYTAIAGDANLDGSVDAADYSIWLSNVGALSSAGKTAILTMTMSSTMAICNSSSKRPCPRRLQRQRHRRAGRLQPVEDELRFDHAARRRR